MQIEWANAGTGQDQYTKLRTVLKPGGARQAGPAFGSEYHRYYAASASGTNNFNAIDPDVTFDESGVPCCRSDRSGTG